MTVFRYDSSCFDGCCINFKNVEQQWDTQELEVCGGHPPACLALPLFCNTLASPLKYENSASAVPDVNTTFLARKTPTSAFLLPLYPPLPPPSLLPSITACPDCSCSLLLEGESHPHTPFNMCLLVCTTLYKNNNNRMFALCVFMEYTCLLTSCHLASCMGVLSCDVIRCSLDCGIPRPLENYGSLTRAVERSLQCLLQASI